MRKDVKLGLAVGGLLFSAVMVYVLFFANAGKTGHDQTRLGSDATADSLKHDEAGTPTAKPDASSAPSRYPLTSLIPHDSTGVSPTTQPADTASNVSIFGPTSYPSTTADAPVTADSTPTPAQSGTFNWRDLLEHGSNSPSHSTTPVTADRSVPSTPFTTPSTSLDATPTAPSGSGPRTYIVKPGDSLWSIAKAEYGSPSYYPHLARANPKAARNLRAGMKLILPSKDEVVPESAKAVLATPKVLDATRQYRVQAGDNLYTICKKLYGKTDRVAKLYELNKDLIGPNRSVLKPNMVLQLPEPPTTGTAVTGGSSSNLDPASTNTLAGALN